MTKPERYAKYVAFDPGVSTGVASWDAECVVLECKILRGMIKLDEYLDALEAQDPKPSVIIYERYRAGFSAEGLRGKWNRVHGGKSIQTEQAIGSILRTARRLSCAVVPQEASILAVAQLHSGVKLNSNHDNSHHEAAFNHGYEYLLKNKLIKPRVATRGNKGK